MKAIYTVPPHPCPPDWRILMHHLTILHKDDGTVRRCAHCGVSFTVSTHHSTKEYHDDKCREAAYVAIRKARRAERLSEEADNAARYRGVHVPTL